MKKLSVTFLFLAITFCVCLVCSNLFVPRLWSLGVFNLQMSGAVLVFPISYIINDLLTEVYGYKASRLVIWIGFVMCLFFSLFAVLVTKLPDPIYPESRQIADNFNSLYSFMPRVLLASLLAFLFGSLVNSLVLSKMKVASGGRHFWFRAIISSIIGELADSIIFFPVAYAGSLRFTGMLELMGTEVVVKTVYEILILPLTILIVRKIKSSEGIDTFDRGISYNPFTVWKV